MAEYCGNCSKSMGVPQEHWKYGDFSYLIKRRAPMNEGRWLPLDKIASYVGVKRDTIYKWIKRSGLPSHKVGRLWKFRTYEIDQWVVNPRSAKKTK